MIKNDKWEYPKIQDLDNYAFILIRQKLYDVLYELHMAENYKIVNPEKEYNVYWENFCETVEWLTTRVDEAINYQTLTDSQSLRKTANNTPEVTSRTVVREMPALNNNEGDLPTTPQSSYPKAKFPEPWLDDHWYYAHDDLLEWIKRCMADYPLSYYQPDPDDWFKKWFSQFKDWEEFDWDKALELHSSPTTAREK